MTTVGNDMPQKPNANLKAACMERLSVLFGAVPYAVHAAVDGSILGTAHSPIMLASLTIPISLCAVQDVGTIIVSLSATKATDRDIFATASCFGIGFPVGASLMTALAGASSTSDADGNSLPQLPCLGCPRLQPVSSFTWRSLSSRRRMRTAGRPTFTICLRLHAASRQLM